MAASSISPRASGPSRTRKRWWWGVAGICGLLALAALLYFSFSSNPAVAKYRTLARFYSSKRKIQAFLQTFGPYAPLVFILLQALQVMIAPIPGELTGFVGGYLFGTGLGFFYSTLGLTLGSALAFGMGRWLGLPVVRRLISKQVYRKFDFLARTGGELATFLCFLIPGFPKDFLCFLLGVSPLPFGTFLAITIFGRMPGTWLLSVQGANVRSARYLEFVVILTATAGLAFLAYMVRGRISRWIREHHGGKASQDDAGDEDW